MASISLKMRKKTNGDDPDDKPGKKTNGDSPDDEIARKKTNGDSTDERGKKKTNGYSTDDEPAKQKTNGDTPDDETESSDDGDEATKRLLTSSTGRTSFRNRRERQATKERRVLRFISSILFIVTIILLMILIYMGTKPKLKQYCAHDDADYVKPRDLKNPGVFDDLTPDEYNSVHTFMLSRSSLAIRQWDDATVDSSYIFMIDLFLPKKDDVVRYLDSSGRRPTRNAKVVVIRGDTKPPRVDEFIVGPLPNPTKADLYRDPSYSRYPIPYTAKPIDMLETNEIEELIETVTEEIYPLLMESYGLCYHNCTKFKNCVYFWEMGPRGRVSGEKKSWWWGFPTVDGFYNHPLGIELLFNHLSVDVDDWTLEKIVYNGQMFESTDSLMAAYNGNKLNTTEIKNHNERMEKYTSYKPRGKVFTPQQGPKMIEPEGKRFTVQGRHVNYRNWDVDIRMSSSSGIQLFNVKFGGKRIAYEISLQEVLVLYTGYGPAQGITNYYDVSWMLGILHNELARGVDCPDTAVFLDTDYWANVGKLDTIRNNICIFENNPNIPLRRHYANDFYGGYDFYAGLPEYSLVIRSVANVLNYDYVFDYIFYTNGAIEVKASATGYTQAAFDLPQERQYGGLLFDHVVADLHHHIFNYKVDLDIAGTSNRYTTVDVGMETVDNPWRPGTTKTQYNIKRKLVRTENDGLQEGPTQSAYHLIHNEHDKNRMGSSRGYRILNKGATGFSMNNYTATPVTSAAKWANYPIVVTKHKDHERTSTTIYAQTEPWDPIIDFDDFLDGDPIVDTDLVAWVTMGIYHIPGAEDVPSTPTTWNQFSFFLQPHNYFDECPSVMSPDVVVIRPQDKGKPPTVDTFGTSFEYTCIPNAKGPFDYDGMHH